MDFEIKCLECGRSFNRFLTNTHLRSHGLTVAQYRERHGNGSDVSQAYREERSRKYSGAGNPMAGRAMADNVKEALRAANAFRPPHNKGKRVEDPEILANLRAASAKREAKYRELGDHPSRGKIVSPETREKIRRANLGRKASEETRKKISAIHLGRPSPMKGKNLLPEHAAKSAQTLRKINHEKSRAAIERKLAFAEGQGFSVIEKETGKWWFRCKSGHLFVRHNMMLDVSRYREDFCPVCNPRDVVVSRGELELFDLVQGLVGVGLAIRGDRSAIAPLELDVYVPSNGVAFEYCGLYWHSEQSGRDRLYHRTKLERCRAAGIRLITVFEDEWLAKPDLVKSHVASALGLDASIRVNARDCTVRRLSPVEARTFVDANHLQGYSPCAVRYGLELNGSLIAAMTFSRPSRSKGGRPADGWEISRFCTSVRVRGGASKMLSVFIGEHSPERIFTFSDLRWGEGSVYSAIGFTRLADSPPGYWYVPPGSSSRVHRFALRKGALSDDDPAMTEFENRDFQGYLRIWDCGNARYEWLAPGKSLADRPIG